MDKASISKVIVLCWLFLIVFGADLARAQADEDAEIFEIPLEELINVTVVSPARVEQQMFDSPNSIWVITGEEIRNSGARSIPEALRLAPGVYVAQLSGNRWTVTIGGMPKGEFSNTLLVLIDGVTVYSTLFGYVEWDLLPVTIDEIDRIEIIRGPGGVLYGANAVNGVINIITINPGSGPQVRARTSVGTQGVLTSTAGGSFTSDDGKFRASYGAGFNEDNGLGAQAGDEVYDYQRLNTVSLRTMFTLSDDLEVGVDGRYLTGEYVQPMGSSAIPESTRLPESGIARVRIDRYFEGGGKLYLQAFYRRHSVFEKEGTEYQLHQDDRTQDLEFQHLIPIQLLGRHNLIYGGGYRWVQIYHKIINDEHSYTVSNAFVHDEWRFHPDWRLNAGLKWEQVSIIDPTWQWRVAMLYYATPDHVFRISGANSFRSPTMLESYQEIVVELPPAMGFLLPAWPPGEPHEIFRLDGKQDLEPEEVHSYEFEYRGLWFNRVYFDASYSYRLYHNLIVQHQTDPGFFVNLPPPMGPFGVVYSFDNGNEAVCHTVEAGIDARLTPNLRAKVNYGYVDMAISGDYNLESSERGQPKHFGRLGLLYSSSQGFQADANAYYTGEVEDFEDVGGSDEYWRLDLRLARSFPTASGEIEVGAVGTNLGQEWHNEGITNQPSEIRRAYYGYVEYKVR